MNRLELVAKIADKHGLSKAEAARILTTITEEIMDAVKNDDPLTLVGFGTFKKQVRPARTGRNPATGASIQIPETSVPKFVPGSLFKNAVNCKKCCGKK
ncbi:MAG: HU family DNA-binding protein [Duodenibacillus sp.]|nr:HU family DNA-binding protein [Duodenibacillus sp.]